MSSLQQSQPLNQQQPNQQSTANNNDESKPSSGNRLLGDLGPGLIDVAIDVIVVDIKIIDQSTLLLLVGDSSGVAIASLGRNEVSNLIKRGDLIKIINCDIRLYKRFMIIYTSSRTCRIVRYGSITKIFNPNINHSKFLWSDGQNNDSRRQSVQIVKAQQEIEFNKQRWWEF